MGKLAAARQKVIDAGRHQKQRRDLRTQAEKRSRHGDQVSRKISTQRAVVQLSAEDRQLLLKNPALASQIPQAAKALQVLISNAEGVEAGSLLKEIWDSMRMDLPILIYDEWGSRCLVSLLDAMGRCSQYMKSVTATECIDAILALPQNANTTDETDELEIDEEDEEYRTRNQLPCDIATLSQHRSSRAIVWKMIDLASEKQRHRIAKALRSIAQELAVHRHGVISLLKLLEVGHSEFSAALIPMLPTLLIDPVGHQLGSRLITDNNRLEIFSAAVEGRIPNLIREKRGVRFLNRLLQVSEEPSEDLLAALRTIALDVFKALKDLVLEYSTDPQMNFLIQAIFKAAAAVGDVALQQQIAMKISAEAVRLATNGIGCHVLVTLLKTGDKKNVVQPLVAVLRQHVSDLVRNDSGSLVVRSIIERDPATLSSSLETLIPSLMQDASGNLVVQNLLKALPPNARQTIVQKYIKPNAVALAQHRYASHVLFAVMDSDATTQHDLTLLLKPHVLQLAQHLNGRFLVEKMVVASKDVRDTVLSNFTTLSEAQGTQHLLCQAYMLSDVRARTKVASLIASQVSTFASSKASSMVLQKLLLAEAKEPQRVLHESLHGALNRSPYLRDELGRNFFGKFVLQLLQVE